jgi:hypothetical protein
VFALSGDPLDTAAMEQMDLQDAIRVIVLTSDKIEDENIDNRTLMETVAVRCRNAKVPIAVELQNEASLRYASPLDDVEFMISKHYGAKMISQAVLNPGVTRVYNELMTTTNDSSEFYTVAVPPELAGKSFKFAQLYFLNQDDEALTLIGIERPGEDRSGRKFVLYPGSPQLGTITPDTVLNKDDRLVLIAVDYPSFVRIDQEDLWQGKILSRH